MTVPTDTTPAPASTPTSGSDDWIAGTPEPAPPAGRPAMSKRTKLTAALATFVLLAGGGLALTQLGGSSTSTAATTQQGFPGGAGRDAPAQGTVTAISATSISVKTTSGTTSTYTISSATQVENDGATSTVSALKVGETVVVLAGGGPGAATSNAADRILAGTSATAGPQGGPPAGSTGSGTAA